MGCGEVRVHFAPAKPLPCVWRDGHRGVIIAFTLHDHRGLPLLCHVYTTCTLAILMHSANEVSGGEKTT